MEQAREPLLPQTTKSATKDPWTLAGRAVDHSHPRTDDDKNKAVTTHSSGRRYHHHQPKGAPPQQATGAADLEEQGYASSSTTSSLSDDDFIVDIDVLDEAEKERLTDLVRLWQEHGRKNHGGDVGDYWFTERGRMVMEAFHGCPLVTDEYCRQLATQQRSIEAREKSQSTIVSCTIVAGAVLVFAWVYVFGLADQQDAV
jgi:hypothetical protein